MSLMGEMVLSKAQRLRDLPVLSVVREQSLELLQCRSSTRRDFARVLRYDQVLSAKILRLVNSTAYGLQSNVIDVENALSFLGDSSLQMLVLGSNVFLPEDLGAPFCIGEYWLHNYMTATAAARVAELSGKAPAAAVFSCGLLHDLGKLALWKSNPEVFGQVLRTRDERGCSFAEAESYLQIPGHHLVGEEVARAWHLPFAIRKSMRFHHRDVLAVGTLEEDVRLKVACVILANHIVKTLELGCAWGREESPLADRMQKALGLGINEIASVEKTLRAERESIAWLWEKTFQSPQRQRA